MSYHLVGWYLRDGTVLVRRISIKAWQALKAWEKGESSEFPELKPHGVEDYVAPSRPRGCHIIN